MLVAIKKYKFYIKKTNFIKFYIKKTNFVKFIIKLK